MVFQWYVLHTLSSQEDKVKQLILKEKEKWPEKNRIREIKIPMLEMAELRRGKKHIVKKKLIPGYIFIEMNMNDEIMFKVRNISGVMGFVTSSNNKPQSMTAEEISSLFTEMDGSKDEQETKTMSRILFGVNDRVKIIEGPFANFEGEVSKINKDKGSVIVNISIFGKHTPIELNYLQISKA